MRKRQLKASLFSVRALSLRDVSCCWLSTKSQVVVLRVRWEQDWLVLLSEQVLSWLRDQMLMLVQLWVLLLLTTTTKRCGTLWKLDWYRFLTLVRGFNWVEDPLTTFQSRTCSCCCNIWSHNRENGVNVLFVSLLDYLATVLLACDWLNWGLLQDSCSLLLLPYRDWCVVWG